MYGSLLKHRGIFLFTKLFEEELNYLHTAYSSASVIVSSLQHNGKNDSKSKPLTIIAFCMYHTPRRKTMTLLLLFHISNQCRWRNSIGIPGLIYSVRFFV